MKDIFDKMQSIVGISKYSQSEIPTPLNVVTDMNNLLFENDPSLLNPNTKFIDIAVKSGRFLTDILDRLMKSNSLIEKFPNEEKRRQHILDNQLYGLATSLTAASVVRSQLYQDAINTGNIRYIKNVPTKESIKEEFGIMNFDVVVGNPPYNNDIYLDFVTLGRRLSTKYTCMITPAKWQGKGGEKNEKFRKDIVPYMSKIVFYKDSTDIFSIEEWGGISYFIMDNIQHMTKQVASICGKNSSLSTGKYPNINYEEHNEKPLILYQNKIISILKKCSNTTMLNKSCLFKRFVYTGEQERGYKDKQKDNDAFVMQGSKFVGYMPIDELFTLNGLHRYKIVTSCMWGNGNCTFDKTGKLLGVTNMHILKPNEVPKGSFEILKYFDTEIECQSFISFMYSKLVAFLIYLGICGATLNAEFWRFVPDPGSFDHIFTDEELYKKYNLTQEEINIIESVIKDRK